jgi:DNA invertase Pin-like site-specific DNA recombinase
MSSNGARAVAYIRVSDDDAKSAASGAGGVGAQRAAIEAWASRRRVQVASWQIDRGIGGAVPIAERPGLVAAYAAVREHRASLLVAASAERFTHDSLVAWLIERAALTEGAAIHTVDGTAHALTRSGASDADEGSWTRGALDLARAYERVRNRARTRDALAAKKSRGERVGAVPYGFRVSADGVHLETCADEQAVIEKVCTLAGEGLSQRAIVASLAASGVVGRTGSPLQQTQVARIVQRT